MGFAKEEGTGLRGAERAQAQVEGLRKSVIAAIHPGEDEGGSCEHVEHRKALGGR